MSWKILLVVGLLLVDLEQSMCVHLTSFISQDGIHGEITFSQDPPAEGEINNNRTIHVTVSLQYKLSLQDDVVWNWKVYEYPVNYVVTDNNRCHTRYIGNFISDLGNLFGPITFLKNETTIYFEFESSTEEFALVGSNGVWGRSLILEGPSGQKICSSITVTEENEERVAVARFTSTVSGSIWFQWVGSHKSNVTDSLIFTNLHHITNHTSSEHDWKIFVTDILEADQDKSGDNCDFLQLVFNPTNSKTDVIGDVGSRLGKVNIIKPNTRFSRSPLAMYRDGHLSTLPSDLLAGQRSLYVVVYDNRHVDSFLSCARIMFHRPQVVKSMLQSDGITGVVTLKQRTQFHPTWVTLNITSVSHEAVDHAGVKIHELPPLPSVGAEDNRCLFTGNIFNPDAVNDEPFHPGGGTQDVYQLGNLSGKYGKLSFINHLYKVWDTYLPLYGKNSIVHRSLVLYRYIDERLPVPWVCGSLLQYQSLTWSAPAVAMSTAVTLFRYPVVGRVVLRQPRNQPWADTTFIIEMIVHADGTQLNDTFDHRWSINELPPGKDFYNWTARCVSAGRIYNPFKVPVEQNKTGSDDKCAPMCRMGDLSGRFGLLNIAGRKRNSLRLTRRIFTDDQVRLSGHGSVVGKSFVLYDDHGPVARGDRLACSRIESVYRRKAVVKNWFSNGASSYVSGKIEFLQQTEYDLTDVDVDVEGLVDASGYHIHLAPVEEHLEFPCEDSTLYGHFNPLNVNPQTSPEHGTPDQYETGDLSGKFGTMDGHTTYLTSYNDSSITLFGHQSILGRSVVIHKKHNNRRWQCSSIERGYSPSSARELRAIASFHHPLGFAYGYIRMTQLIYNDGSSSDTVIEVNLRHPGQFDTNVTHNHNWAIFVNPVSVDATVKVYNTRCTAGGYLWNPYYTQLADPNNDDLYRAECGPDNPLRCYVGDLSSRLGTINLGTKRQIFSDGNIPLEGPVSVMGRSVVIFTPERGGDRFACSNIEPDKDIIKYVNIRKTPRFVGSQFLQDIRHVMGIPEWYLTLDSRKTKELHTGSCVQFLLHFKGPEASRLEQDFSTLITTGKLAAPSLFIPGSYPSATRKSSISYKLCGTDLPRNKNKNKYVYKTNSSSSRLRFYYVVLLINISLIV